MVYACKCRAQWQTQRAPLGCARDSRVRHPNSLWCATQTEGYGSLDLSKLWLFNDQRLGRKEPNVIIIGVDYHPSFQQIAFLDQEVSVVNGD